MLEELWEEVWRMNLELPKNGLGNDVNGIVHTHSNYATSFAVLGRSIPICLTAMAHEFGRPIPVVVG